MTKKPRTSFDLTEITEPILRELKLAGWDYTEVLNAGILAFSQLDEKQKNIFRASAYGLKLEHSENARDIFRNWIVQIVADAQATPAKKKPARQGQLLKICVIS